MIVISLRLLNLMLVMRNGEIWWFPTLGDPEGPHLIGWVLEFWFLTEERLKGLRARVSPSKEKLKRLWLTLLDKRKLRGNITDIYKIREAVNNLSYSKSHSTRNRVYLLKPEGALLRTGQTVIYIIYVIWVVPLEVAKTHSYSSFRKGLDKFRTKHRYWRNI